MKRFMLYLGWPLLFWSVNAFAGDLWISILSLPPELEYKAFGIYVHCPNAHRETLLELYEMKMLSSGIVEKNKLGEVWAEATEQGVNLNLSARSGEKIPLALTVDRSKSFAVAPFTYRAKVSLDPDFYTLSQHQATLSALIFNPQYPAVSDQPEWNENLSNCTLNESVR